MKKLLGLLIVTCALLSCNQNGNNNKPVTAEVDTTRFFQIAEFIKGEIAEVNKTPYFIYKIDIHHNKKDLTPVNTAVFNELAKTFLTSDINDPAVKTNYKESVFFDETTNNYTLSYATTNKDLEIQNAEVLLQEDGKKVKRILIRKFVNYADSSVIEQLSWKPGESFRINRSVSNNNNEETHQILVAWNEQ